MTGIMCTNFWTNKIVYNRPYYAQAYMQNIDIGSVLIDDGDKARFSARNVLHSGAVAASNECGVDPVSCEMDPVSCEMDPVSCDVSCASCSCSCS